MATSAVAGAHLTGTRDTLRPSVFEILSHEGFASALKPAVFHVIKIFAEKNPAGKFSVVYRYFDELYLGFDAIIQWHYILTRGATLSEAFYGLERKLVISHGKLSTIRLSYLVAVLLPYFSDKLDKFHKTQLEVIEDNNARNNDKISNERKSLTHTLSRNFILLFPYFRAIMKMMNLVYLVLYSFGRSDHHNLTFKLTKMTLTYTSEERSKFLGAKNAELFMPSEWKKPRNVPKLILRSVGESALWMVEIGTFFIQFLDWWNNDENRARIMVASQSIPPAPHTATPQKVQNFVPLRPTEIDKCPLCRQEFTNPTVISVSGVAYCYGCIFPYLQQERKCPLTRLPCDSNNLIRVYR